MARNEEEEDRKRQRRYKQGMFRPRNPSKYKGDPGRIVYRSSWEKKLMDYLDTHPEVIQWSSEEVIVPYFDPTVQRVRRYFPDFIIKTRTPRGLDTIMIEVKPAAQTQPPKQRARKTPKYLAECQLFARNLMKWQAAKKFCEDRGWKFQIMTEHNLDIR